MNNFWETLQYWCGLRLAGEAFAVQAEMVWQQVLRQGVAIQMTETQIVAAAEKVLIQKVGPQVAGKIVQSLTLKEFTQVLLRTYGETVVGGGGGGKTAVLQKVGTVGARTALRGPILVGAAILALASAGCAAKDEYQESQNLVQLYFHYMKNYVNWAMKVRKQHPHRFVAQPASFEEWSAKREMIPHPH